MTEELKIWIDSLSFLPIELERTTEKAVRNSKETVYSDYGAAIDIQVPPEVLHPTASSRHLANTAVFATA